MSIRYAARRARAGQPGPRRDRWLLAALTSTMVLLVLDSSIVGAMLPSIERDLSLTATQSSWLVSSYLLTLAVFMPLGGRLADAVGPVTLFRAGMAAFVAASAGIALSPDFTALVAGRALAGVAGALLMPATMSLITLGFPEQRRAGAMAFYTGVGQGFARSARRSAACALSSSAGGGASPSTSRSAWPAWP
jgi:DHA2 family methylenomycin A resistance protein-like MFS transporter